MGEGARYDAVVVGGGLVGSLLATFLARRDLRVGVFERRSDPRADQGEAGRSINLVLTARGFAALDRVGLRSGARELTVPVTGRMIHGPGGELAYQPYGRNRSECNHSISRGELNRFLVSAAEARGVRFHFDSALVELDAERSRLEFERADGGRFEIDAPVVFGADGAGSAVRAALARRPGYRESIEPLGWGYKELTIPAGPRRAYRIEPHALHVWPRGRVMLMALANRDGSFTVTLYLPDEGVASFAETDTPRRVRELFESEFSDAPPLIPDLERSFFANPTGTLGTVRFRPWHLGGRVLVIGDAAHAVVPFFGQGMNCGFEDCSVLDELLQRHGTADWERVFREFDAARKPDADAIADMALENFVEMRDRVADPAFLLRKQVEHILEQRMPTEYRSRYSMVMYSSIPYAVAREAGRIQERILAELCEGLGDAENLDLERGRELIARELGPFLARRGVRLDY